MYANLNSSKKAVILYIITGLYAGGAERMLYNLLSKIDRVKFQPVVISLMDIGVWGERILELEIPVHCIGTKPGTVSASAAWQLIALVRRLKPDLIQGWMYHANLAAQLSKVLAFKSIPVIWNIRHSLYSLDYEKSGTVSVIQILNKLSNFPAKIIYNSKVGAAQHEKLGYPAKKTIVIPNGFNIELFKPSIASRLSIRRELGLPDDAILIGRIARFDPMKDHANFLEAAALLLKDHPNLHFLLAGTKVDWENQTIFQLAHRLEINEKVHLLGQRQDTHHITSALDIACSSSFYGEAFPNVIGEAMSCGVPCVVTDVGDSAWIVGNTGRVVPSQNSQALAKACQELLDLGQEERKVLGKAARDRVIECFSLNSVVAKYEQLYEAFLIK